MPLSYDKFKSSSDHGRDATWNKKNEKSGKSTSPGRRSVRLVEELMTKQVSTRLGGFMTLVAGKKGGKRKCLFAGRYEGVESEFAFQQTFVVGIVVVMLFKKVFQAQNFLGDELSDGLYFVIRQILRCAERGQVGCINRTVENVHCQEQAKCSDDDMLAKKIHCQVIKVQTSFKNWIVSFLINRYFHFPCSIGRGSENWGMQSERPQVARNCF